MAAATALVPAMHCRTNYFLLMASGAECIAGQGERERMGPMASFTFDAFVKAVIVVRAAMTIAAGARQRLRMAARRMRIVTAGARRLSVFGVVGVHCRVTAGTRTLRATLDVMR